MKITLNCDECRIPFERGEWYISPKHNYCSRACTRIAQSATTKEVPCATCKTLVQRTKRELSPHKVYYCGQKCRLAAIRIYTPRERILRRKEISVLWGLYGTSSVSLPLRKISAMMQTHRKGFGTRTLTLIRKGKTHEAYI